MRMPNVLVERGVDSSITEIIETDSGFNRFLKELARHKQVVMVSLKQEDSSSSQKPTENIRRTMTTSNEVIAPYHSDKITHGDTLENFLKNHYLELRTKFNVPLGLDTLQLKKFIQYYEDPFLKHLGKVGAIALCDYSDNDNHTIFLGIVWKSESAASTRNALWIWLSNNYYMLLKRYGKRFDDSFRKWVSKSNKIYFILPLDLSDRLSSRR